MISNIQSKISLFRIHSLSNRIFKSIPFPEFIVIVLRLVPLLQIQIVIRKEMVVVLRANNLILQFLLHVLVRVKISRFVLPQLVIVVLIIKIFGTQMVALCHRVTKLIYYLLEPCPCLLRVLLIKRGVSINVQQLHLLVNVVHRLLKVALLAVSRKVQGLKRRKCSHQLLVTQNLFIFTPNFASNCFELLPWELNTIGLSKLDHCYHIHISPMISINLINNCTELKSVLFHKLFP